MQTDGGIYICVPEATTDEGGDGSGGGGGGDPAAAAAGAPVAAAPKRPKSGPEPPITIAYTSDSWAFDERAATNLRSGSGVRHGADGKAVGGGGVGGGGGRVPSGQVFNRGSSGGRRYAPRPGDGRTRHRAGAGTGTSSQRQQQQRGGGGLVPSSFAPSLGQQRRTRNRRHGVASSSSILGGLLADDDDFNIAEQSSEDDDDGQNSSRGGHDGNVGQRKQCEANGGAQAPTTHSAVAVAPPSSSTDEDQRWSAAQLMSRQPLAAKDMWTFRFRLTDSAWAQRHFAGRVPEYFVDLQAIPNPTSTEEALEPVVRSYTPVAYSAADQTLTFCIKPVSYTHLTLPTIYSV